MNETDRQRVQTFIETWKGSQGDERANYQGFFRDLCDALGVDRPPPKGNVADVPYCFDKDGFSTNYTHFYKEGQFPDRSGRLLLSLRTVDGIKGQFPKTWNGWNGLVCSSCVKKGKLNVGNMLKCSRLASTFQAAFVANKGVL